MKKFLYPTSGSFGNPLFLSQLEINPLIQQPTEKQLGNVDHLWPPSSWAATGTETFSFCGVRGVRVSQLCKQTKNKIDEFFSHNLSFSWRNISSWITRQNMHVEWSFQERNTKLERCLAKNKLQSNEIIEFCELL